MAKYIGSITTDIRGKVGGLVFTKARNGTNLKANRRGTNPATSYQLAVRQAIQQSLVAWRTLTAAEQLSWGAIAATQTWSNSLGQTFTPSGLQLWTQAFVNASWFGATPPATASGSPSTIDPITSAQMNVTGTTANLFAYTASFAYPIKWIAFVGFASNYSSAFRMGATRTFCGLGSNAGPLNIAGMYGARYGVLPVAFKYYNVILKPLDYLNYYSGTLYKAVIESN